jgi:hypothetical protein
MEKGRLNPQDTNAQVSRVEEEAQVSWYHFPFGFEERYDLLQEE